MMDLCPGRDMAAYGSISPIERHTGILSARGTLIGVYRENGAMCCHGALAAPVRGATL